SEKARKAPRSEGSKPPAAHRRVAPGLVRLGLVAPLSARRIRPTGSFRTTRRPGSTRRLRPPRSAGTSRAERSAGSSRSSTASRRPEADLELERSALQLLPCFLLIVRQHGA